MCDPKRSRPNGACEVFRVGRCVIVGVLRRPTRQKTCIGSAGTIIPLACCIFNLTNRGKGYWTTLSSNSGSQLATLMRQRPQPAILDGWQCPLSSVDPQIWWKHASESRLFQSLCYPVLLISNRSTPVLSWIRKKKAVIRELFMSKAHTGIHPLTHLCCYCEDATDKSPQLSTRPLHSLSIDCSVACLGSSIHLNEPKRIN